MKKLSTWAPMIREAEEKELSILQKNWREYFMAKMNKYGVKSPAELSEEDKKDFFNELKKDWERGEGATSAGKKDVEVHGVKESINEGAGSKKLQDFLTYCIDTAAQYTEDDLSHIAGQHPRDLDDAIRMVLAEIPKESKRKFIDAVEDYIEKNKLDESVNEKEIKSEDEFREYAQVVLKNAHGNDYDESIAKETIDGILAKAKDDFGAAVGMLTSSLD